MERVTLHGRRKCGMVAEALQTEPPQQHKGDVSRGGRGEEHLEIAGNMNTDGSHSAGKISFTKEDIHRRRKMWRVGACSPR